MSDQRRVVAFSHKSVKYFLPDSPPVTLDSGKEWNENRSRFVLVESDVRPVRAEHYPQKGDQAWFE